MSPGKAGIWTIVAISMIVSIIVAIYVIRKADRGD